MRAGLWFLLLLVGCAGVDADIRRAEWREGFMDLVRGKDRGIWNFATTIDKATTKVQADGRYQYIAPAHVSQYLVDRSVRGLGGTRLRNGRYVAAVADRLLHVLNHDPTPTVRATACLQLGRLLLLLPVPLDTVPAHDPASNDRINEIAYDLASFNERLEQGKTVPEAAVVERLRALSKERPTRFLNAVQMVRILTVRPVSGSVPGPLTALLSEVGPVIVRDCILIALREVACGDPFEEVEADSGAQVRSDALDVLARVGSPIAVTAAATRLQNADDPTERHPDVRRALLIYLGEVGGPRAFDACLLRLDDFDSGVRFHAHRALRKMTGVKIAGSGEAWRAWREEHPDWERPIAGPNQG
ncbi:MAG: HEAT repeat domain-containing protein [Planctomycetota bacterium]|jgi:hypothetical protein